ncbi:SDR family oxidoreductase [Raineyella fluvialis]|uniref:NAD(P)H-binding protein n=1 Tax=Raineyella fluvialis TaxID=2662261 RepID=A0A5Q2FGC4_9ACTN|nr:NAD(P)H-binding protein [Raineyella fluvialis]QGF24574.1 NAD(P)H-binding protein [Raineyella fluvialis]
MISIVGGTGRLGGLVAVRLLADGHRVRLISRQAHADMPQGAEFVAADVRRPETLTAALSGSRVVVAAMHGVDPASGESPAEVDRDGSTALFAAARAEGADIVFVSIRGASADHPMELVRMKGLAEQALRAGESARKDWTIVRPTAYVETWADLIRQTAAPRGVPTVFGKGLNPMNFVTVNDAAVAVTRAVTDAGLRGSVIDVGGPQDLTMVELARLVTHQQKVNHVPRVMLRILGTVLASAKPAQARLIRMSLQMDTLPLTFDPGPVREAFPWLPCTPVQEALAGAGGVDRRPRTAA